MNAIIAMGCDYYHEALLALNDDVDGSELSNDTSEIKFIVKVYDPSEKVTHREITVDVPPAGKVYVDAILGEAVRSR